LERLKHPEKFSKKIKNQEALVKLGKHFYFQFKKSSYLLLFIIHGLIKPCRQVVLLNEKIPNPKTESTKWYTFKLAIAFPVYAFSH